MTTKRKLAGVGHVIEAVIEGPPPPSLTWITLAQFIGHISRDDGKQCALVVQKIGDSWQVGALETSATSVADIFDDHAHKMVGEYATPGDAIRAAETFAVAWRKGFKSTAAAKCDCDELAAGAEG